MSDNLDHLNEAVCLASSVAAYLNAINNRYARSTKLKLVATEIYDNVNLWLARLFRFHDSNAYFHLTNTNDYDGAVNMARLILNIKYDNLNEQSYKLFAEKEPVFYISAASKYAQLEYRKKLAAEVG